MKLEFTCKCNCGDGPAYINGLVVKTSNDTILLLDRRHTEYVCEENVHICEWREVYIWDGNNEILLPNDLQPEGWTFIDFDFDCEAPIDLNCKMLSMTVNGIAVTIH